VIADGLRLELDGTRDEVRVQRAPHGKEWRLRAIVAERGTDAGSPVFVQNARPEVEVVGPPAVGEQYDSGATVTELGVFAGCARKYWLTRSVGDPGTRGGEGSKEVGTEVHEVLAGTATEPSAEALRLAQVFRRSELGQRAERASRREREFDFVIAVEDVVVRGQIDLWFEDGRELVIVDYKTDGVSGVEAHQRARDYATQVRLYAMAVEQAAGRPPDRAWLHFLRPDKAVAVDLRPSLLESPEQVVREFRDAQESGEYPLNVGAHCARCAFYRGACPAG
jgi:CRISPR/Cas system-associated exonuclease Cas4 (RecB family)